MFTREVLGELLERHHAVIRRELSRFRGEERDTAGDGFFATFDGPARAIRCAQAVIEGVRELGLEVGGAFDVDAPPHVFGSAEPSHRHLDERHPQRLEVPNENSRALFGRQLAQADLDVARCDAAASRQQRVGKAAKHAPEAELRPKGQQDQEPHPGDP